MLNTHTRLIHYSLSHTHNHKYIYIYTGYTHTLSCVERETIERKREIMRTVQRGERLHDPYTHIPHPWLTHNTHSTHSTAYNTHTPV